MKNVFMKMMVIAMMLFAGSAAMTSCVPEVGAPVLEVGAPNVISAARVEIPLRTESLSSIGYRLIEVKEGETPTPPANAMMLYRNGKKIDGNAKKIVLTTEDGLDMKKSFIIYIAAAISDTEFYDNGKIFSAEFTTPNNWADDDVYVMNQNSEGANIKVMVPQRIKEQNRRIKWGIANIAMINYYGKAPIPEKLHCNDIMYPATLIKNDTVLEVNHANAYRRNANGEIGYYYFAGYDKNGCIALGECGPDDPRVETGEADVVQYFQHFQPGEPLVLMMSEVDWAGCTEIARLDGQEYIDHITSGSCGEKHPMIDWGWGPGWYWYPYDYEKYIEDVNAGRQPGELPDMGVGGSNDQPTIDYDKYWIGEDAWHKYIEINLPGPEEFTTGDVIVNTSALRTDGGKITFTPTGDTFAYFVGICPDTSAMGAGYRDLLNMIDNKPGLLQWLTTSEIAPYLGIYPYYTEEGVVVMNLEEVIYEIEAGMSYHIIVNAVPGKMVNGDLMPDVSKQKFQHITFRLPEYTLPEPELEVTAYEAYSPYKVKFNIKNANPSLPVKKVVYAANYTRDFSSYMKQYGYTYGDIVLSNDGYANLSTEEIAQVNSDFGYDMEFDVRENALFTLAVMGWNQEGRASDPDKEGSKAVAEAKSLYMQNAEPLDMTKLNALKGDWTATATVKTYDYNTGNISTANKSWKVSIGELNANMSLTADEYKVFEDAGVDKATTDYYLGEYNKQAKIYNEAVLGQNRVLCLGWDITGTRETSTASPWGLFLMPDYNASVVDYLFYDFGPKWFLQTDAEGNIFVPVNYNIVAPMMCWYNGLEHYLVSGNFEKGIANYINPSLPEDVQSVGIPVEISADGNTITLKSVAAATDTENITLYPTMIYNNQGQLAFYNPYVMSEVVLTKGWSGSATPASAKLSKSLQGKRVVNSGDFKAPTKVFSRTLFVPKKAVKTTVVTKKNPTKEEIRKGMDKLMSKYGLSVRR